jgi:prepilin-type N-terminal cleavage/methylation domain-containing protein
MEQSRTLSATRAAFSLVEVMCAVAILGISLVSLTQGITAALKSSKESEVQTTAALIAAGRIETLRADGFIIEGETEGACEGGLDLYQWRESITTTDIDGLYDVQVAVENSKTGKTIYELQTLLFDPPVLSTSEDASTPRDRRRKRDGRQ